jgi:hypothetical protein
MAIIPETAPAPASAAPRWRRFLTPWRSPADQPAWARPALLAIAAVAAVAYGWGMAGASVERLYGAAARSMPESWHDFIFGAFDPAGTVTRARTRGCGGSNRTAPGSPRPRTAARSRMRTSSADPGHWGQGEAGALAQD